jgi:hypothetical protein
MADKTKITLSDKELELVMNKDWILAKRSVIETVSQLLADMVPQIDEHIIGKGLFEEFGNFQNAPKISKGENYLGLPYVVLDYPRYFSEENVFAVRTMFWWGNFFSITLHMAGAFKTKFVQKLRSDPGSFPSDFYVCINDYEWDHHFELSNFVPAKDLDQIGFIDMISQKKFIKLGLKHDLLHWNEMPALLTDDYYKMGVLLAAQPVK